MKNENTKDRYRLLFALLWLVTGIFNLSSLTVMGDSDAPIDESATPEEKGKELSSLILSRAPIENYQTKGFLTTRSRSGERKRMQISSTVYTSPSMTWTNVFQIAELNGRVRNEYLIVRRPDRPNEYYRAFGQVDAKGRTLIEKLNDPFVTIGGSGFMVGDMGFEFLFWPSQVVTKHTLKSGRKAYVLESKQKEPQVYSKILTWIDKKTLGPMKAEAYDLNGRLLKRFSVGGIREIQGQKVVSRFDMDDRKTGSFSRIEFKE